jgi:uncharacterized membrane protein required for colicin V production
MLFSCGAILLLAVIIGYRRGLLGSLLRVIAVIISVVAAFVLAPLVVDLLYENTTLDEDIEQKIYTKIESGIHKQVADALEDAGVKTEDIPELAKEETKSIMEEGTDRATQVEMIRNMKMPKILIDKLIENNNDNMYKSLNVTGFYKYVSSYLTRSIMNIIGTAGTYLVIQIILIIICWILTSLVREVPILAGINRLGGMILGAVVGLALIWIFMTVAALALHNSYNSLIGDNPLLVWLDENNIFMKMLMHFKV